MRWCFLVFDPSTLGQAPATLKIFEKESLLIDGEEIPARKITLSFKGTKQSAWVDDDAQVLKEAGNAGDYPCKKQPWPMPYTGFL